MKMPAPDLIKPQNVLLTRLPRGVLNRIRPNLKATSLRSGAVLHRPGEQIRELYFPITCMISVTITMKDGRTVEAGAIGSREVSGINTFMGGRETTQTEYIVQLPGKALTISAEQMKKEFDRNTEMRDALLRYTQAFVAHITQNVGCNRLHGNQQRFARWLLEVRDRVQSNNFPLTQEFISQMLGVRRASVTDAAVQFKEKGLIRYGRGRIEVTNLSGLEETSCECYATLKQEYDRLLGNRPFMKAAEASRFVS